MLEAATRAMILDCRINRIGGFDPAGNLGALGLPRRVRFDRSKFIRPTAFRKRRRRAVSALLNDEPKQTADAETYVSLSMSKQQNGSPVTHRMTRGAGPSFFAVDFFCGAGGTTRGLIDAGGYVIAGIDKESRCEQTYVENNSNQTLDKAPPRYLKYDIFPKSGLYPGGEQDILLDQLSKLIPKKRRKAPKTPLLFAICAPCQPFTTLARKQMSVKRKEKRDRDSNLLLEATKFIEQFRPELVLSENVAGIKDPRYGGIWQDFRASLRELGYVTGSKVVCTSRFGVPQYRKRSILLAVRGDMVNSEGLARMFKDELDVPDEDSSAAVVTVKQAIGHLPPLEAGRTHEHVPNHRTRSLSELNLQRIAAAPPGESNRYMESTSFGDLSLACHRRVNARLDDRCFTDVYTRMHPDRPSPTITTRCHSISNGRFGHFDTGQNRGISLREAAALQSFKDDYVFYPLEQIEPVARMIGNAVPPRLAQFFAAHLAGLLQLRQPMRRRAKNPASG